MPNSVPNWLLQCWCPGEVPRQPGWWMPCYWNGQFEVPCSCVQVRCAVIEDLPVTDCEGLGATPWYSVANSHFPLLIAMPGRRLPCHHSMVVHRQRMRPQHTVCGGGHCGILWTQLIHLQATLLSSTCVFVNLMCIGSWLLAVRLATSHPARRRQIPAVEVLWKSGSHPPQPWNSA